MESKVAKCDCILEVHDARVSTTFALINLGENKLAGQPGPKVNFQILY